MKFTFATICTVAILAACSHATDPAGPDGTSASRAMLTAPGPVIMPTSSSTHLIGSDPATYTPKSNKSTSAKSKWSGAKSNAKTKASTAKSSAKTKASAAKSNAAAGWSSLKSGAKNDLSTAKTNIRGAASLGDHSMIEKISKQLDQ